MEDFCRQKEIPFTRYEDPSLVSARRRPDSKDEADDLGLARKRTAMDVDEDESDDEEYEEGSDSSLAEDYDSEVSGSGSDDYEEDDDE